MTEGELETWFDRLLGRSPTDEERNILLNVHRVLGLNDDDPMWLILLVLGHYEHLLEKIPDRIEAAGSFAIERAKRALEMETEAERRRIQGALTDAVLETVKETTTDRIKAERFAATAVAGAVCLAVMIVVGAVGYRWGYDNGQVSANAAQLWATSPTGRYAQRLDDYGLLGLLRTCRASDGDFRVDREARIICETRDGQVQSIGPIPDGVLAAD